MQVEIVENWASLTGTVAGFTKTSDLDGHGVLTVTVRTALPVPGMANLLKDSARQTLAFYVRLSEVATEPVVGAEVMFRARKASPFRLFADGASLRLAEQH